MFSPQPLTRSRAARLRRDAGNATVEFLLVSILVVIVALGVVQLAIAVHVRNILASSAHEGAHYGALADRTASEGEDRTRSLVASALGGLPMQTDASQVLIDGVPALEMRVTAKLPLIGLWGVGEQEVVAHALVEVPGG